MVTNQRKTQGEVVVFVSGSRDDLKDTTSVGQKRLQRPKKVTFGLHNPKKVTEGGYSEKMLT